MVKMVKNYGRNLDVKEKNNYPWRLIQIFFKYFLKTIHGTTCGIFKIQLKSMLLGIQIGCRMSLKDFD